MTDDAPLIDDDVDNLLVTIDVMALVRMFGPTLWSCRLCGHADAAPGEASMLRSIGEHMTQKHRAART